MKILKFSICPLVFGKIDRFGLLREHHINARVEPHTYNGEFFPYCSSDVCQKCLNVFDFNGLRQIKRVCIHLLPDHACCSKYAIVPLQPRK